MANLNSYTQQDYLAINKNLRKNRNHEAVETITAQLQEVRSFSGTVYRGLTLEKSEIRETFKVGRLYRDRGFLSCSKDPVRASKFSCLGVPLSRTEERSITLVIESQSGKDISKFSKYPEELEVLFPPMTGFEVVSINFDGWEEYTIVLKEI
jgi:hypothetical protein